MVDRWWGCGEDVVAKLWCVDVVERWWGCCGDVVAKQLESGD